MIQNKLKNCGNHLIAFQSFLDFIKFKNCQNLSTDEGGFKAP